MAQLSLLDFQTEHVSAESTPSQVYDLPNRRQGHLRIDSADGHWLFTNEGGGVIKFGHLSGPTVELTAEQLRVLGDYCHRMADRIEAGRG